MAQDSVEQRPRVIACVAVRMKSKRLQFKPLRVIEGKPMIVQLVERVKASKEIDSVVLCTSTHPDDEILVDTAAACGIEHIAGSEDDIISRFLQAADREGAGHVVRVTGDNPLTDPELSDIIVRHHLQTAADYTRIDNAPIGVAPECIAIEALAECRRLIATDPSRSEYMMLYLYDPARFHVEVLELPSHLTRPHYSATVDTAQDLACVRRVFRRLCKPGRVIGFKDIIEFMDENPRDYTVSAGAPIKLPGREVMTFEEWQGLVEVRRRHSRRAPITI